jgi:hypothetical protein
MGLNNTWQALPPHQEAADKVFNLKREDEHGHKCRANIAT